MGLTLQDNYDYDQKGSAKPEKRFYKIDRFKKRFISTWFTWLGLITHQSKYTIASCHQISCYSGR